MKNLVKGLEMAADTRSLAERAVENLSPSQAAYRISRGRVRRPVDYMRYAEFEAILRDLSPAAGMTILDVSSPQWFSLCLASRHPDVEFHYANICEDELEPFRDIAQALGIQNLRYQKEDVREMRFAAGIFDRVVSISVVEHVYPEEGGDVNALREIHRVLKPGGEFLFTVPYKTKSNIVYKEGAVYERKAEGRNFYAREYDEGTFRELVEKSDFALAGSWVICEKGGVFPVDYYEWGPGRDRAWAKTLVGFRKVLEKKLGKSLDEALARHYLQVSREVVGRPVNIAARMLKK